ncbi:isopentenyl-diphosphate Delta-isomerase [Mucilaginibacter myungsuensis]|uniref:Isopentenyl-diphosphate delta-isomerase n=1 Tax=Mucilaginibacter myungsuensis TaxID=649104 RepID=A0A929L1U1_9SPHI|nr:isopentenyl-diphosphate Delta-isomerase [Mucilaginibacter myungsuensis]MBE9662939.1 isopentenyl-diphosphate Delta-isomerase [Mucilaginibacter myungsuensis]MDN3598560.1 isopentenyl-diphosphate Delta-isomerase [Mucilaginibacter myungsuensis]
MKDAVMIVDRQDRMQGTMDKMAAHRTGTLHRALSVFIFNSDGELLLQQRAMGKYHSGGLWTNTCCSHPRLGEPVAAAAERRLWEEMGMRTILNHTFSFYYHAQVSEELIEHEFDHVFFGSSDALPSIDPAEAVGYRYLSMDELAKDMEAYPERYTAWLAICFGQVKEHYTKFVK